MKKKLALIVAPIALLAASTTMAATLCGITPYLGADAEFRHMNFRKGFGKDQLSHNYPQGNLYAGLRFNEYFAVEAGYEATERKTISSMAPAGAVAFGFTIPAGTFDQYNSTSQTQAFHANLVGTLPICERYRLQLIGMVGFARLNTKINRTIVALDGFAIPAGEPDSFDKFVSKKSVLRLGAGLQHMINCNWGVRAMLKWENSNKLRLISKEHPTVLSVSAKNSLIYSIGAFYNF